MGAGAIAVPKFQTILDAQGNPVEFPSGMTDAQISAVLAKDASSSKTSSPTATVSAAPARPWLNDLEDDMMKGGGRTFIGRGLGKMQDRGDMGYTGLRSGVSPEVANFMGSPAMGSIHAAQGASAYGDDLTQGDFNKIPGDTLKTLGGVAEASTIPSMVVGGPAAKAGIEAIPSMDYAGNVFKSVMQDAADVPVSLTRAGDPLLRIQELGQTGSVMPKAARQLLSKVTTPGETPLTYQNARDFASNISRLSADEYNRLTPVMKNALGNLRVAFNSDIGDAASAVGRGEDYAKAMKEYAQSAQIKQVAKNAGKAVLGALGGVGAVAAGRKLYHVFSD